MKPILKWPGGKRRLAAKISEAFGEKCRGRYIEPFVGGAAVYLHRFAAGELIGQCYLRDINRRLISTYKNVAKKPEMVHGLVSSLQAQHERAADKKCFYNLVRSAFNVDVGESIEQAARMIWLNKTCFNGLYRENNSGEFNTPYASNQAHGMPSLYDILMFREVIVGAFLQCGHFDFLDPSGFKPGDQIYLDPPYLSEGGAFTTYSACGFGLREHHALADLAVRAANRGAKVVISNSDNELTRGVYLSSMGFKVFESIEYKYTIGGGSKPVKKSKELILTIG